METQETLYHTFLNISQKEYQPAFLVF